MCECQNETFKMIGNNLWMWDDYLQDFFKEKELNYNYCPICGQYLKEQKSPETLQEIDDRILRDLIISSSTDPKILNEL